jgi:hypothetical protein
VSRSSGRGLLAAAAVAALVASGCSGGGEEASPPPEATGETIEVAGGTATPYGEGDGRVWLLLPTGGEVESIVVYLHGWGANLPVEWHQAWFEHLIARGSAVLFPQFQDGFDDAFVATPYDLRDGLRLGFRALDRADLPVVAAGFSVGATLAFVYAANAAGWEVPAPRAVYSIFPVDPFQVDPTLDLSEITDEDVLILTGDRDAVVGGLGADGLARLLTSLPRQRREIRLVRTSDAFVADHEAPTFVENPAVRKTFWEPLDELVDASRS